ncbi:hypothetical protein [Streptomyces spectabilis]|uniref:Uncharacterized protein n=1 Tax=Streptomyces spectabilis TaxID=68270 RepID=A0A516RJW1_STRST|nr:hypothetical protein [Streptomyces spectabilis]QDQ15952.1 hypothetical protein FH965_39870 [Streptomyces spectabilis]
MNRRHIRLGAVAALAALTLGATDAQAATHCEMTASAPASPSSQPYFKSLPAEKWSSIRAEGQGLPKEDLPRQAKVSGTTQGGAATKGILGKLKKALKKAFKVLPDSWEGKFTAWAKKGKGHFQNKWKTLPGWAKKSLTVGVRYLPR